ncbi:MAG: hypothetical protein P9L98_04775 [Candidatus Kaelpia imicola]|nr:hypothetical protein [Candidatus Kaelpia imicola]
MKRGCNYIKITLLVLSLFLLPAYIYGQDAPVIEAIDSPWDFGQVKRGEIVRDYFNSYRNYSVYSKLNLLQTKNTIALSRRR